MRPERTAIENMVNEAMPQMPVAKPSRPSMRVNDVGECHQIDYGDGVGEPSEHDLAGSKRVDDDADF